MLLEGMPERRVQVELGAVASAPADPLDDAFLFQVAGAEALERVLRARDAAARRVPVSRGA